MTTHERRSRAILETINSIKSATKDSVDIDSLVAAKAHVIALASQRELFPDDEFPMPTGDLDERTVCIYSEPDGQYAMYVNLVAHGANSTPHDHGNSWAIISGIEGYEKQSFYECTSSDPANKTAELDKKADIIVKPDMAVTMLVGGIHSVEGVNPEPSMFLHCYGRTFETQEGRREFDTDTNTYTHSMDAVAQMEYMPLHPSVA